MKPAERRLCLPQSWLGIVVLAQTVFLAIMAVCLQAYFVRVSILLGGMFALERMTDGLAAESGRVVGSDPRFHRFG